MRSSLSRVATTILVGLLASACGSVSVSSPAINPSPMATPSATSAMATTLPPTSVPPATTEPTGTPISDIDHETGATDIVLRFDDGPGDYGLCELCGGWSSFTPGPEFTLYGDGTVIFRDEGAQPVPPDGPIIRARPFRIGRLDEEQVQSLLRFALGEGGLGEARDRYATSTDTDDPGHSIYTIRAGGVDKRVEIEGSNDPFGALAGRLRDLDRESNLSTEVWAPERYWGLLIEVSSWIDVGVLGEPDGADVVAWPWPGIAPWSSGTAMVPDFEHQRRVMSSKEAAVMGLSDEGGVVQRIYLHEPDGETVYSFSLWPMLPDERS